MSSPASAPAGSASAPSTSSAAPPTTSRNSTISPAAASPPPPSPPPPAQNAAPAPAESPPPPPSTEAAPTPSSSSPPAQSPPPPAASSSSPRASPSASTASPPAASTVLTSPPPPSSNALSPPAGTTTAALAPPPPPPPPAATPPPSSSNGISTSTVAAIAIVAVFALSVLLVLGLCFCKKTKKKKRHYRYSEGLPAHYNDSYYNPNSSNASETIDVTLNKPPRPPPPPLTTSNHDLSSAAGHSGASKGIGNSNLLLAYNDLAAATNGFLKANLLGEGGFGCVYKGVLANGQVVAVKQLKSGASQGEKEFQAEVETISRVHHRHLVSLVGYCMMDSQRLLVYDYVPNNTLEYHLHRKKEGPALDWATRLRIASGAARGLAYLHEDCHPRIIHRDIKSANILLDNDFEAQVSDFGLAKLTSDTCTHVTTRVMGTFGYLAPEYASSGKLTEKSDVFSFGVVLLELLTGRKPVDVLQPPGYESLVEWARPILAQIGSEEDLHMLADPSLNGVYDRKQMMQMIMAAAACVSHSAIKRPRMGQVVRALEDETSLADLYKGLKPGHSSVYGSSFSSGEYEKGSYSADIRKFRMALNESTDGGMLTNPSSSSEYPGSRPKNSVFSSSSEFPTSS